MQENPIAPNADVQALVDEGYSVVIVDDRYLIVENVPYCPAAGQVAYGDIISPFSVINGISQLNNDHTVWFTGTIPHTAQGKSLRDALVADAEVTDVAGRRARCRLSNKPALQGDLDRLLQSFHVKMHHYVNKLSRHARDVDGQAFANYRGQLQINSKPSVFYYPNTAIARSGLDAYEEKLHQKKVAIIGVGGTGSYILDALAKMPIEEVHIYDADQIEPHNVYRMPGALTPGQAFAGTQKADYLAGHYSQMRSGVIGHAERVDDANINELSDCSFVFIAVDHGPSRGLIANYLVGRGIPFIDVGIGVNKIVEKVQLHARAHVTLVTPQTSDLLTKLPTADDTDEDVYHNIQLVELNALNAVLAVIRYKQYIGFYTDEAEAEIIKYKASWSDLMVINRSRA